MKNNDKLFDEIGKIDDRHIPALVKEKKKKTRIITAAAITTAAAAVCLTVLNPLGLGKSPWEDYRIYPAFDYKNQRAVYDEKPKIDYSLPGYFIHWNDESDTLSHLFTREDMERNLSRNPWKDGDNFSELPVFKNDFFDGYYIKLEGYLSEEELNGMMTNVVKALGLTEEKGEAEFYYEEGGEFPLWLSAVFGGEKYGVDTVDVLIWGNGYLDIEFGCGGEEKSGCLMPDFESTSDKEKLKLIVKSFGNLIQYKNPALAGCDEGTEGGAYLLYDRSRSAVQNILNYSLSGVSFEFNGDLLTEIRIENHFSEVNYLGDYPAVSLERAKELFSCGSFLCNIPDEFFKDGEPSIEDVKGAELIYYSLGDPYYKPFYRFYTELGYKGPDGETLYGDIYVPAIEWEYIETDAYTPDFTDVSKQS